MDLFDLYVSNVVAYVNTNNEIALANRQIKK